MSKKKIFRVSIPNSRHDYFDYTACPSYALKDHQCGKRVVVPLGRQQVQGVLVGESLESAVQTEKLKSILSIIDQQPVLPDAILKLCHFASEYYHQPLSDVVNNALPGLLRKGRAIEQPEADKPLATESMAIPTLNQQQQQAVSHLKQQSSFSCTLLEGVTGSGKTEVYLQAIAEHVKQGGQVLILVPEIGLTPQLLARFQQRFALPIAVMHSGLTEKKRLHAWSLAFFGEAKIIIGTRSAVFTPIPRLKMIVIDESHDASFKQQERFRYSARDLAIVRAQQENIPVVLGSATPSLESLFNVAKEKYHHLQLTQRAGLASQVKFTLVDLRQQKCHEGLSPPLLTLMQQHLASGNQVLLFINRRGFSPVLMCHQCGWLANCHHCDAYFTFHKQANRLQCHHCGFAQRVVSHCPSCGCQNMMPMGVGTERLEQALQSLFPEYQVVRIDRDTVKQGKAFTVMLEAIHQGEVDILLGTQMLAKGHHFPNVTLAAIVNADNGLFSADFRASEKLGQLLLQVAGRAGRAEKPGEVVIQTHLPDHPLLQQLIHEGYSAFAQSLLQERQAAQLPPYQHMALFRAQAKQLEAATDLLCQIKQDLESVNKNRVMMLGPMPSPMEKKAGFFHAQLLCQSEKRQDLQACLRSIRSSLLRLRLNRKVRWSLDVDPMDLF